MEEVDKGDFFVAFDGEDVNIVAYIGHYFRFCAEILHEIILSLEGGGFFKSELLGERGHLFAEFLRYFSRVSFENFATGLDVAHIIFVRLFAEHARAGAFADVIVQTEVIFPRSHPFFCHRLVARARMVEALAEIQQGVHRREVAIRPIVGGSSAFAVARFENAGEVFVRDGNIWIGLVVFEQHIVARLVLLDERIFKEQRIFLRIHHGVRDVADLRDEQGGLSTLLLLIKIGRDAALQVFGLPDIDNCPFVVIILVAARLFGQVEHNSFEIGFQSFAFFVRHVGLCLGERGKCRESGAAV